MLPKELRRNLAILIKLYTFFIGTIFGVFLLWLIVKDVKKKFLKSNPPNQISSNLLILFKYI